MNYTYRRKQAFHYEVVRERDERTVAVFIRGNLHSWYIVSADSEKMIAGELRYLQDAKDEFEAYAKRRRGQI